MLSVKEKSDRNENHSDNDYEPPEIHHKIENRLGGWIGDEGPGGPTSDEKKNRHQKWQDRENQPEGFVLRVHLVLI